MDFLYLHIFDRFFFLSNSTFMYIFIDFCFRYNLLMCVQSILVMMHGHFIHTTNERFGTRYELLNG